MENQNSSSTNIEQVPVENPDVQTTDVVAITTLEASGVATTGEITVVDSLTTGEITHHSVLSDHQLEVDGVIYRELKTLNRVVIQVLFQTTNDQFLFLILALRLLIYLFFSNFRMDQMLERMIKYLSTPDPLETRITLSKKSTLKDQILVMKEALRR